MRYLKVIGLTFSSELVCADADDDHDDDSTGEEEDPVPESSPPSSKRKQATKPWIPELRLDETHKKILESNGWFSDEIIQAVHTLLKLEHPTTNGLMFTTVLSAGAVAQSERGKQNVVQIHHDRVRSHWYCSSNKDGRVDIYDSLSPNGLTDDSRLQLKSLYNLNTEAVLHYPHVDQQENGNDCGPYAVAFATSLCHDINPSKVMYPGDLRGHILSCFEKGSMTPFPSINKRGRIRKPFELKIK